MRAVTAWLVAAVVEQGGSSWVYVWPCSPVPPPPRYLRRFHALSSPWRERLECIYHTHSRALIFYHLEIVTCKLSRLETASRLCWYSGSGSVYFSQDLIYWGQVCFLGKLLHHYSNHYKCCVGSCVSTPWPQTKTFNQLYIQLSQHSNLAPNLANFATKVTLNAFELCPRQKNINQRGLIVSVVAFPTSRLYITQSPGRVLISGPDRRLDSIMAQASTQNTEPPHSKPFRINWSVAVEEVRLHGGGWRVGDEYLQIVFVDINFASQYINKRIYECLCIAF